VDIYLTCIVHSKKSCLPSGALQVDRNCVQQKQACLPLGALRVDMPIKGGQVYRAQQNSHVYPRKPHLRLLRKRTIT
jgi:hypothetical protein